VDSGAPQATQIAAAWGLSALPAHGPALRAVYRERRDAALDGLRALGCPVPTPGGAFFVWGRVPEGESAMDFAARVFEGTGVLLTPGTGFGEGGEGYFRVALTSPVDVIRRAIAKLEALTPWRTRDASPSAAIR
jgi:LL-diaminopimelate aminotransferase